MKRVLIVLTLVGCILIVVTGFDFLPYTSQQQQEAEPKKACKGYVVLEAGKGINCNGDTIKLTKKHGFFEVAANHATNLELQKGLN